MKPTSRHQSRHAVGIHPHASFPLIVEPGGNLQAEGHHSVRLACKGQASHACVDFVRQTAPQNVERLY